MGISSSIAAAFAVQTVAQALTLDFTTVEKPINALGRRDLSLPIYNDLAQQWLLVNISVGTPARPYSVLMDTASTDLWLPKPNSSGCAPNPCPPGTFDVKKSKTAKDAGIPYTVYFGLQPDEQMHGEYYTDIVRIGGVTIPNQLFAVADVIPSRMALFTGILGLGSPLQEALYQPPVQNASLLYTPIWQILAGPKRRFSIWLDDISAKKGRLSFGDIDHSLYTGKLKSTPLVLDEGNFTQWAFDVSSIVRVNGNGTRDILTTPEDLSRVVPDTGSPNIYLPTPLYAAITAPLNPVTINNTIYIRCSFRTSFKAHLEFQFPGKAGKAGPLISVPYSEIIYPFGYPDKEGGLRDEAGNELCYSGVLPNGDGPVRLLGAPFLRSAYAVYDAGNLEIGLAQAKVGRR